MALLRAEKSKREQLEVRYNTYESHDIICQVIYLHMYPQAVRQQVQDGVSHNTFFC